MFTKEEYRAEIDAAAAKAAKSQAEYDAAIKAETEANYAKVNAYDAWQQSLKQLDAAVRLYVKAHLTSNDGSKTP